MVTAQQNRIDGSSNPFAGAYSDQCTFWAQQRYHALTGVWTPCTGNGYQWASQAGASGWYVTTQPPTGVPSIICLQPGTQTADRNFGHVGVVERINGDGTVYTSNYNVYPHIGDKVVVYVTFTIGNGVSFIYAGNNTGSLSKSIQMATFVGNGVATLGTTYSLSSNSTIAETLSSMDLLLALKNPFDIQNAQQDTVGPVTFTDPVNWLTQLGNNIVADLVALLLRGILIVLGVYLLFRVLAHFVDFGAVSQNATNVAMKIAPMIAGA